MPSKDIDGVTVDGQMVYYRPGEVIAVGEAARRFVESRRGTRRDELPRGGESQGDGELTVSALPTAFRFIDLDDSIAVVNEARARGLRVQLNHVFFAHCGCQCDSCCGANPYGAFPYKATPYKATPYKATPYKATAPTTTNAKQAAARELAPPTELAGAQNVTVWVIDTGKTDGKVRTPLDNFVFGDDEDHPDQDPQLGDELVDPVAGHGTFIGGIIEQLTPGCTIDIRQVIEPAGDLEEWDVAQAIHVLVTKYFGNALSRTILNLSFGGGMYSSCNPMVGEAIAAAQEVGVVVVASAGNEASCRPVYPANFPGVVSVGAVDSVGEPAHFTNRGSWVQACALGVDVVSTFFDFDLVEQDAFTGQPPQPDFRGGWAIWSGTSFAAPVVVAAIAREMSTVMTAVEARDAVLGKGSAVPCLGVRVDDGDSEDDFSSAELLASVN